ncbi:variant erythrocyte surface antigen-1 family protein [Babesia caballi]|uniref:Variant erythrocyte surface antigen-1 family protein n=1 Tax=Babesia caballi TaxID=5871 RepID=A0AAV4LMZ6_BABCB|nr:variant erythrocyte surface antigen-1 family protein [Babesia caballi]
MSPGQKSLTRPPSNLKEAIDWVLKIKEIRATDDLAAALEALLKHDGSEVAVRVKEVYEKICEKFCKDCEKHYNHASYLKQYLKKLPTFEPVEGSVAETGETVLKMLKGESGNFKYSITTLAGSLQTFLGCDTSELMHFNGKGIIKNSEANYNPAYKNAAWIPTEASKCTVILLAVLPMLFLGIAYLHSRCSGSGDKGWNDMSIKGMNGRNVSAFGYFLTEMGFPEGVLNGEKKGSEVHSQVSGFTELKISDTSSIDHPYNFSTKLHQKAFEASPPSPSSPLTSLYLLSQYYITYPLHDVQSTNPATPSFLSYSGTAALAGGAYGLNLGGLGTFMSALLA